MTFCQDGGLILVAMPIKEKEPLKNHYQNSDQQKKVANTDLDNKEKKISNIIPSRYAFLKPHPFISGDRFYNHQHEYQENSVYRLVQMFIEGLYNRYYYKSIGKQNWFIKPEIQARSIEPRITWIGHATFLIQVNNINILTDPIWGRPSFLFPRIIQPGIALDKLPALDAVIISHNHWDHLEKKSITYLAEKNPQAQFFVPMGDKKLLESWDIKYIYEKLWWESEKISISNSQPSSHITFTFLPAYHWSQCNFWNRNCSLWGSWMIETNNTRIYFGGDTAYSKHFKEIGTHYSNDIDFALLPIAPCEPKRMRYTHINAKQAGQGLLDLGARHFIPMHWATFFFGTDRFFTPIEYLKNWWKEHESKLSNCHLHILKCGEHIQFNIENSLIHTIDKVFNRIQP